MKLRSKLIVTIAVVVLAFCGFAFSGCGYCQHKLSELEKVPSTCVEAGLRTAYKCDKCGEMFGYTDEKGLYGIKEREPAPLGKHAVGAGLEMTSDGEIKSLADVSVFSVCALCEERFEVDKEGLIPFTPSDNDDVATAKHVKIGKVSATEYTFPAGTKSGAFQIIKPLNDSKSDAHADVEVPFTANTSRYLVMYIYNGGNADVPIKYGAECYNERCMSEQKVVPAGGYASFSVDIKFSRSDPRSYHELYIMKNLDAAATLTAFGYYYTSDKIQSVTLSSKGRTEFATGEKLDLDAITLTASYGNNVSRILSADEYTVNLAGKELTAADKKVVITYKNKKFTFGITVANYTRSENYARGKACTASETGFMPSRFGLGNLTDGLFDNYNAWGSNAHDDADATVWAQVDLGSAISFNNVTLYPRHDGCYFPKSYYIEVSDDGEHFTRVFTEDSDKQADAFGTDPRRCDFDSVSARYVRIVGTRLTNSTGGSYYFEIGEIEVYMLTEVDNV